MKECSWKVSPEDINRLLVRTNADGTMTVSLGGINDRVTLSQNGKYQIRIDDTGSEINVHVTIEDVKNEYGNRSGIILAKSCRLKDFSVVFEPVGPYIPEISNLEFSKKDVPKFDWMDGLNFGVGSLSSCNTYQSGYFKYNELWHNTKTRGVSWSVQSKWKNPGAKYWRQQQVKPFQKARYGTAAKFIKGAGWGALGLDVALSGEVKVSHVINGGMVGLSYTGWGSVVSVIWFVADFGTMGVNWVIGNGAKGLGDIIDEAIGRPIIELYEGWY
jgi:hypothetical protein